MPVVVQEPMDEVYLSVRAKVAELVDARDLGSRGFVPWGFESPLSHFGATLPTSSIRVEHRCSARTHVV